MHIRSHNANIKANSLTVSPIPADKLNFKLREDDDLMTECGPPVSAEFTPAPARSNSASPTSNVASTGNGRHPIKIFKIKKKSGSDCQPDDVAEPANGNVTSSPLRKGSVEDADNAPTTTKTEEPKKNTSSSSNAKTATENSAAPPSKEAKPGGGSPKIGTATTFLNSAQSVTVTPIPAKPEDIVLASSDDDSDQSFDDRDIGLVPCRECQVEVSNLQRHFRGPNRPLKEYSCDTCQFFNPSPCALKAHVRMMHARSQPYVCPDCGFFFNQLDTFLAHVKTVCFYHYKTIRFKCPECSELKPSVKLFTEHLQQRHVREVFKCSMCVMSSYTLRVVQNHMEKEHPGQPGQVLEGYRCMICPNLLVSKQTVDAHVKKHVYPLQYLRYVYICESCQKYATRRMSKFKAHYRVCPDRPAGSREPEATARPAKKSTPRVRKSPEEATTAPSKDKDLPACKEKDLPIAREKDPLSIEDWETDRLKAEYGAKTKVCVMCRTTRLNDQSRSLFCNACVSYVNADEATEGATSNENAPAADVGRSKRKFKCRLCKQFMNRDWSTITNHYEQDHQAEFDVTPQRSKGGGGEYGGQRKRRSSVKSEATVATKSAKIEPKYSCVKCGLSTSVRNYFHAHITSHKAQSNTEFQCLECGECFIVKPSLEKHLVVVHKVRDLKEYYRENKVEDEDDIKRELLAENQCEVCYLECGSKQNYDKHIRTHGMAFVAMQSRVRS